ncbi:MAG TPA: FGGY-family carbohydrate kinase [Aggregatilineales bacterium]|nr:FGGY-family carbohydrate kinase [Aggregatilineales bacterium]
MSSILAIDAGSSSVRAMLDGHITQISYAPHATPDGGVTVDPSQLLAITAEAIDRTLAAAPGSAVAAVAMDTFVGNLMGVADDPTTPLFTWADTRRLDRPLDLEAAAYRERTGTRIHPSYWPLRLDWLAVQHPGDFARTRYWMSFSDYFLFRLFGVRRVSPSVAAWSGLLNRHTMQWDEATLRVLPVRRSQLSEISGEPVRGLPATWAARWPRLRDVPWFPAVGDGYAANVGVGCVTPEFTALTLGTSGALRVLIPGIPAQAPDGLFAYRVDSARTLVGGAMSSAGNLFAWMTQTFAIDEAAIEAAAEIAPDGHGLTMLPFLAGERAPGWNAKARAVFSGMSLSTTPAELLRAGLEAVAYQCYQIGRRLPVRSKAIIAGGTAIAASPLWAEIIADVLGVPVIVSTEVEATLRGTAALAAGIDPAPAEGRRFEPNPAHHDIYRYAVARQETLYHQVLG